MDRARSDQKSLGLESMSRQDFMSIDIRPGSSPASGAAQQHPQHTGSAEPVQVGSKVTPLNFLITSHRCPVHPMHPPSDETCDPALGGWK